MNFEAIFDAYYVQQTFKQGTVLLGFLKQDAEQQNAKGSCTGVDTRIVHVGASVFKFE